MTATAPTADDLAAVSERTLTARQAVAEFGLSRSELFRLMADGVIDWFPYGEKRDAPHRTPLARRVPRGNPRRVQAREEGDVTAEW
jgi:predicted DNA-binding transcriptional regulator AlpA